MSAWTHGRCPKCRLVYKWRGKPLLRDARCMPCGGAELGGVRAASTGLAHERTGAQMLPPAEKLVGVVRNVQGTLDELNAKLGGFRCSHGIIAPLPEGT